MTGYAKTCAVLQIFDTHPPAAAGSTAPCRCGLTRSQRDASLGSKHLWPRAAAAATAPRRASRMAPATGTLGPPSRALREPGSETRPFFPCSEETLLFPVPRGQGSSWPSSRPRVPFPPNPMPPLQPALPPLCPHPPNSRRRGGTGYSGSVPRGSGWPLCPLLRALLLPAAASKTTSALGRAAGRPRGPGGHVCFVPPALEGAETLQRASHRQPTKRSA